MDMLTLIGLITGVAVVVAAMLTDASVSTFLNWPSVAIVVGGTFAVTLIKYRLPGILGAFRLALSTTFLERGDHPVALIAQVNELAKVVRRDGILGMERFETRDAFLLKAINLAVDGHTPEMVEDALLQEMEQDMTRYQVAEKVFRGIGETAPALGMLGTLVGLVQMLNNMQDPASIGPAMAIALLTTFYGAFIAQVVALPLADKLQLKAQDDYRNKMLILTSMQQILKGQNPRLMTELLTAFLSPEQRIQLVQPAGIGEAAADTTLPKGL